MIRLLLLLAFVAPPAMAQQAGCDPEGSQAEMNECASADLAVADAELNDTYARIVASIKRQPAEDASVALERLKTAQRLWIQLRDADLAAQFPLAEGQSPRVQYGSIYPLEHAGAKAELTRQRTAYLRRVFSAQLDGDH
jgi:uncharacterized protein YecT (DUF1311 family)